MQELDVIDPALAALRELAERQTQLESSQDRAREAWRDLAAQIRELRGVLPLIEEMQTRLQEIEQHLRRRISPEQRNTLYRLVQAYGEARARHQGHTQPGGDIQKSWRELNQRFSIATYTDLPAARFDEAVQFIKTQYRALTGQDIESGTQERLM